MNKGAGAGGAAKTVQVPTSPTVPKPEPTPEELAAKKAKKQERNKRLAQRRKEKKKQKKKEEDEAKAAAGRTSPPLPTLAASSSSSEEDSPRKSPLRSRYNRVLGETAKKSLLFEHLNSISEEESEQLGVEIERVYRAKTASEGDGDTAVIFADLHSKLVGGRKTREIAVMDSGCTRDIISEDICKDLNLQMWKLDRPLNIVTADGSTLNIIATCTLYLSCQATRDRKKKIEAAVLAGARTGKSWSV